MTACASSSLTRVGRERKKYCLGFVSAAEEAARLLAAHSPPGEKRDYCFPEGKTAGYFAEVFRRYASRKSTDLDKPAVLVVIEALENSFTCEN
ncbi:MAG: Rap1a/Tai family immunity protein [Thiogranum sp.]